MRALFVVAFAAWAVFSIVGFAKARCELSDAVEELAGASGIPTYLPRPAWCPNGGTDAERPEGLAEGPAGE